MIWLLVVVPIVVGFALYLFPRRADDAAKSVAVVAAFGAFAATIALASAPDESARWLSRPFVASFHVGLGHGPSYWLVLLLTLVTGCALLATSGPRRRDLLAQLLLLQGAMTGVFVARDLLLFALFWDLMLIPVFIVMIGSPSAWRYLIYNAAGGLALLLATAAFGIVAGSTDVLGGAGVMGGAMLGPYAPWIFSGLAFAFLVKTPAWPLHTWMPATYADLPPSVVTVVSAVQSKAGLYGFIVIGVALFPATMSAAAPLMFAFGLVGLVYGAVVALVENDAKRVVAYSSLSHLGLILIAIFSGNAVALGGAVVYIIAHGLFSAMLFLSLGQVEEREGTRLLDRLGGIGARNPRLAGALCIAVLATLGLPGLAGFAGEILIITGLYGSGHLWPTVVALVAIVIASAYMLRLYQDIMNGPERGDVPQRPDLTLVEGLALAPLVVALVLLGVYPAPLASPYVPTPPATSASAGATLAERAP
jgi:NADH-quinone oxidoreductase subunit M